jgi:hypothetical protein
LLWGDSSALLLWGDSSALLLWGDSSALLLWGDRAKYPEKLIGHAAIGSANSGKWVNIVREWSHVWVLCDDVTT